MKSRHKKLTRNDSLAMKLIYIHSQGYPRRITTFCHDALIKMLREEKKAVDEKLVLDLIRSEVNWYAK